MNVAVLISPLGQAGKVLRHVTGPIGMIVVGTIVDVHDAHSRMRRRAWSNVGFNRSRTNISRFIK